MPEDLKGMYRTVMDDHFPSSITIQFGDQNWNTGKGHGRYLMKNRGAH